jgi:hypothetical protein
MEIKLTFQITMVNEEVIEQTFTVPALNDPNVPFEQQQIIVMNKALTQYAQVGMLKQVEPRKFLLVCPSQIACVECELPSILIANPSDVPAAPKVTLD